MNHVIYLSEHGPTCDTRGFKRILEASPEIGFVIGPPEGFSERPQGELLSLSPLTFPHEMAMCVLVEQIYRAKTLIEGHPYHK
jgi:23S rRNA (pseudouridine1915-N3)-methyltransferase